MNRLLPIIIYFLFVACNSPTAINTQDKAISTPPKEITLDRPHYKMKYYADCTMDSSDTDFDIDSYFSLNTASNNGSTSFFIYNTSIDEKQFLDAQVKAHLEKTMKNGKVSPFITWGNYKGHGATITGKLLGTVNAEIKIFVYSSDSCAFLTAYQVYESDKEQDLPGLKLIESTFKMK